MTHTAQNDLGLRKDIASLLNRYSRENASGTPDFILADYLAACLDAYDGAVAAREKCYGRGKDRVLFVGHADHVVEAPTLPTDDLT